MRACDRVPQLVDILKGYVDMGVMMQKPSAGGERELRRHYKVCTSTVNYVLFQCIYAYKITGFGKMGV